MSAGKGDTPRPVDNKRWQEGYNRIFRKPEKLPCFNCGSTGLVSGTVERGAVKNVTCPICMGKGYRERKVER